MNNNEEYVPGLTELRINVKAFHSMADKITKDLAALMKKVDDIEKQNSTLIQENIDIKQTLQTIHAKLYEKGIR